MGHAELVDQRLQRSSLGAVADDQQMAVGVGGKDLGPGADGLVEALAGDQAANGHHDPLAREPEARAERGVVRAERESFRINAVFR